MTILVLHQAVPSTFYNKLAPMYKGITEWFAYICTTAHLQCNLQRWCARQCIVTFGNLPLRKVSFTL